MNWKGNCHISFYNHLGECCPQLTHLKFGAGLEVSKNQALALFLGKLQFQLLLLMPFNQVNEQSSDWGLENELHHIQMADSKQTAPFCQTLEHLEFNLKTEYCNSLIAFLLRHLPRLRTWTVKINGRQPVPSVFAAIQLLHSERYRLTCQEKQPISKSIQLHQLNVTEVFGRRNSLLLGIDSADLRNCSLDWIVNSPPPRKNAIFFFFFFYYFFFFFFFKNKKNNYFFGKILF